MGNKALRQPGEELATGKSGHPRTRPSVATMNRVGMAACITLHTGSPCAAATFR
jgi:hypothetical protein